MIQSERISRVRVLPVPVGISGNGIANQLTGFAVVKWYSDYGNLPHQVYVDGKFAGVTTESLQRQMIVPVALLEGYANRIEVFAVDNAEANTNFSESISVGQIQSRLKIEFPKTVDGSVDFYVGEDKQNKESIELNKSWEKCGFGLGSFGTSDLGFDRNATVGFGKGNFALGWFGFDCELFSWTSGQLTSGNYKFKVVITDENGNGKQTETENITIIEQAKPADKITIQSFDKQTNKLILNFIGD
ncbi:MAG: hypothetical protein A2Y12_10820 [Planctomycetes bacterium GWF2_42_9]|nr:MAG: hypothetical protein A2Y12_10820 [Planctomycetes bacterium GWF2_42_9]HAL45744.1 hypothetical protein [Phycisphaerales bacterium]